MDLELTDEQTWLASRSTPCCDASGRRGARRGRRHETRGPVAALVEFGALAVDREDGLGAVELCLVARATGAHLASVPLLGSAAVRFALEPPPPSCPTPSATSATSAWPSRCSSRARLVRRRRPQPSSAPAA